MVLIFGGAYQGKLAYALERFRLPENDVFFCSETNADVPNGKIVYEIDKWILALVRADVDAAEKIEQLAADNPNAIIICNDISCGIVPIDPILRKWREEAGKAIGRLAQYSEETVRLFCGIPTRIK